MWRLTSSGGPKARQGAEAIIANDSNEAAEVAAQHARDVQNMVVNFASLRDEDSVRERS